MIKKISAIGISIASLFMFAAPAFAHVIVRPKQVGVAAWQEFTMSVPTEKDNSTVGVKLLIPNGLVNVSPNVKAGWTINEVKTGSGEDAKVTEIDWTGGNIPAGQRDDFLFQTQVPAKETTLKWKAYQTYQDGSVVAWDHAPSKNPEDDAAPPPYSQTKIVNDLTGSGANTSPTSPSQNAKLPMELSIIAIALSAAAIGIALRKKSA
ncbi:MAG TPA: YcnI family protein [Candidatus Saccharimonadales bacterium]|nr:YcnI family protein [Candidatus Saccharimonadales bacterium]